jgi:glycerol 2-dehydrogenase (NADP+)
MATSDVPCLKLNNGVSMPAVGIGCWMGRVGDGNHVKTMVKRALELGYRHIDTAANYGNEKSVGEALRESNIPRKDIFLTTKLAGEDHGRVADALNRSVTSLGVEYVDLFLMHWPQAFRETGESLAPEESPTFVETWEAMEKLLDSGKTRSIGVSNFSIKTLTTLLQSARVIPAVNQVEVHPCLPQNALLSFCQARGITVTAYSPIGKHKFATDAEIAEISRTKAVSEAQIILSWGVQRGTAVIPKAEREDRMKQNISLVHLTREEMRVLDKLHEKAGMHRSVCGFHSTELGGSCFGWTYEQLGWDMVSGGVVPDKTAQAAE